MKYPTQESEDARHKMTSEAAMEKYPAGFYWIRTSGIDEPVIAEHSTYDLWYLCGLDYSIDDVEVVSARLEPPQ